MLREIEKEIEASKQEEKAINLILVRSEEGLYKALSSFSLEGEYILNSKEIKNQIVTVEQNGHEITVHGIESDKLEINAFLTKNKGSILSALKDNLKRDNLQVEPFFIVGPPGTGKSTVITKTIEEALKDSKRILVASPTHMAVENVFERVDLNTIGLKDGELLLTIKTENKSLASYNPELILERKKKSIEDEISLLNEIKQELLEKRRGIEPILHSKKKEEEGYLTIASNLKQRLEKFYSELKVLENRLLEISSRIETLDSNALIRSLSKMLLSKKIEELAEEKKSVSLEIKIKEEEIEKTKKELEKNNNKFDKKSFKELKKELEEIRENISKVDDEVKKLIKKSDEINFSSLFSKAKLVGATLASASISKTLQKQKFDMVIIDEASMALYPMLIAASQVIDTEKKVKATGYNESDSFTKAQNEAIKRSLESQLILIGDPRQLSPIASTQEMRETVFDRFGIEKIFDGENLKNTVFLDMNFRNHPVITEFISNFFYGGLLKSGKTEAKNSQSLYIRRSFSKMVSSQGSYINMGNCYLVVEQVKRALKRGRRSIGIISPFRKQAELINKNLASLRREYPDADIQAGTIHKFQGKEKEIIIFDITFSPSNSDTKLPAAYEGSIKSEVAKLLNVATTRAEDFFILVGDTDGISKLNSKNSVLVEWVKGIQKLV